MLLNDFYTITELNPAEGAVEAELEINAGHPIFEGHFPGQPVTPGVCMMQMIKEIAEKATDRKLQLQKAAELKFLAVIDPQKNNRVRAKLNYAVNDDGLQVIASIFKDELMHFKFKGSFRFLDPA